MKTRLHYVLGWIDRLLLVTVAGLMVVSLREIKHLAAVFEQPAEPVVAAESPPHRQPEFMMTASRHTISFSPGGVTESRVSQVARSLSKEVGWEGAPVSQAADMRERDGLYDISFALARQFDEKSVQATTDGNVLSLIASAIGNPQAKYIVRQFYVPINPAQIGFVETNVSNGVVRIRIHPEKF